MINTDVLYLAEQAEKLAEKINQTPCPPGENPQVFGREMAIARTNMQTAALWLYQAAGAVKA